MSEAVVTAPPARAARPSVMSLNVKERAALYAAYMPFVKNGGLFIPTNKAFALGDDVYLILTLMEDPTKLPIAGKVIWVTPGNVSSGKQPGVGIQFPADETGDQARARIENLLGQALKSSRQTHTI